MQGPELLVFLGISVLFSCYVVQILLALFNAANAGDTSPSALRRVFGGLPQITRTWTTAGLIFFFPILISWLSSISEALLELQGGRALYSACLSTLLVLVTLEFSQLNDVNPRNRDKWRGLLLLSLALDIVAVVLLAWPIKHHAYRTGQADWAAVVSYLVLIGPAAFVSSFLVIIFCKRAGEE